MKKLLLAGVTAFLLNLSLSTTQGSSSTLTVINVNDSGTGSLRQALLDANALTGTNLIRFNLPGSNSHTILLFSPLPDITTPVIIDGSSQPGYAGIPVIALDGGQFNIGEAPLPNRSLVTPPPPPGVDGIVVTASNSTVRGLMLYGFDTGIRLEGTGGNTVQGNYIGTDGSGSYLIGNNSDGIYVSSPGNLIGGTSPGTGNVISGNIGNGLFVETASASNNIVQGNFIGVDSDGTSGLGNFGNGVLLAYGAAGNTIGGTSAGSGNLIAFNEAVGVALDPDADAGNAILGNSIFYNGTLGIDLGNDGTTPNHFGNVNTGPNHFQNFPVLLVAGAGDGSTLIQGTLNSTPNTLFRLEFFGNPSNEGNSYEGQTFVGAATVTTDAGGNRDFLVSVLADVPVNHLITATATDADGNTSEFSEAVPVVSSSPPTIITQPVGTNVSPGTTVIFSVVAEGTPALSFQWRLNGQNIPGATNYRLVIPSAQLANGGTYTVVVGNPFGTVTSDPAMLVFSVPSPPVGDNFVDRVPLSGASGTVTGTNNFATKEPGEPDYADKPGGQSVWYTWQAPADGIATFRTTGSTFDTLLGVYLGAPVSNLTEVASDDDSGGFFTSAARFNVTAGQQYHIALDGFGRASGNFVLSWDFEATPQELPMIVEQPESITVGPGSNCTFSVSVAKRLVPYTFQWFFNGAPIPGATSHSLTISNVQPDSVGIYLVRVSVSNLVVASHAVSLQINLTGQEVQPVLAYDKLLDAAVSGNLLVLGTPPPLLAANPKSGRSPRAASTVVRGYTGSQVFNSFGATTGTEDENYCDVVCGASEWIKFVAEEDGVLYVNTYGSTFDTVVAVYGKVDTNTTLSQLDCDDNSGPDNVSSALSVPVQAGKTNFIVLDGVKGSTGVLVLNYSLVIPARLVVLGKTPGGANHLQLIGRTDMNFTLLSALELSRWLPLITSNAPTGTFDFIDTSSTNAVIRFYRALMLP